MTLAVTCEDFTLSSSFLFFFFFLKKAKPRDITTSVSRSHTWHHLVVCDSLNALEFVRHNTPKFTSWISLFNSIIMQSQMSTRKNIKINKQYTLIYSAFWISITYCQRMRGQTHPVGIFNVAYTVFVMLYDTSRQHPFIFHPTLQPACLWHRPHKYTTGPTIFLSSSTKIMGYKKPALSAY